MSFQSILQREGWKPQNLFTKILCYKCLSRRLPYTYKLISTTTVKPQTTLLDHFRKELYQPNKYTKPESTVYRPFTETVMARRNARKRLFKRYWRLKTRSPQQLAQLTRKDVDFFITKFTVVSDNLLSKRPMIEAYYILKELKEGRFIHVPFGNQEAERMICLAAELKWTDKTMALLKEFILEEKRPLTIRAFDAALELLAENQDVTEMNFWFDYIVKQKLEMTEATIRPFVMYYIDMGKPELAAAFIKKNKEKLAVKKLSELYATYWQDTQQLLERTLNSFSSQAIAERKLHLARHIYKLKTKSGMNSYKSLKKLMSRCIHKKELRTAEIILNDTISLKDTRGAQLCSEYIINHYLSRFNVGQSLAIWDIMQQGGMDLNQQTTDDLLIQCAKAKYHVDVLRLYQRRQEIYPNPSLEVQVYAVRCMVFSKELVQAKILSKGLVESLPKMNKDLSMLAARSLLSLCAKSGDLGLFERTFKQIETLGLKLRHKSLTSLSACYVMRNNAKSAKIAFQNIVQHTNGPDVVDFNILMRTVILEDQTMNHEKILEILKHMALVNIMPDETTMRTMLKYYEPESSVLPELYKKLLEMPLRGSDLVYLNNIAISKLLTRHGIQDIAGRFLFNDKGLILPEQRGRAIERDGITYKILLTACLQTFNHSSIAEKLIKDMLSRNIKPPRNLYESFIQALCKQKKISKARRYIENMEANTGEKPNQKTYTKLADALYDMNKPELGKEVLTQNLAKDSFDRYIKRRLEGKI
ncbi:unnamed protein product [Rhizopus stolonifer]